MFPCNQILISENEVELEKFALLFLNFVLVLIDERRKFGTIFSVNVITQKPVMKDREKLHLSSF